MSDERTHNFPGMWLPVQVLMHSDLSSHEVLLLCAIGSLSKNSDGSGCWASNAYLAPIVKLSPSTVSSILKGLYERDYIIVIRDKDAAGRDLRQMFLTDKAKRLSAGLPTSDTRPEPGPDDRSGDTPPFGGPKPPPLAGQSPPLAGQTHVVDYNNISLSRVGVREDVSDLHDRVMEAAGEAIDLGRAPQMAVIRDLIVLMVDAPESPACTADEIVDAVRWAAAKMIAEHGKGSMVTWNLPCRKAREYRDKRIKGVPVKADAKAAAPDMGDVRAWDATRWRAAFKLGDKLGRWPDGMGPEPGADGCLVPAELAAEWLQRKGVAA